jgi:hypothetical protein
VIGQKFGWRVAQGKRANKNPPFFLFFFFNIHFPQKEKRKYRKKKKENIQRVFFCSSPFMKFFPSPVKKRKKKSMQVSDPP